MEEGVGKTTKSLEIPRNTGAPPWPHKLTGPLQPQCRFLGYSPAWHLWLQLPEPGQMWKANLWLLPQPQRIQHLFPDSRYWGPFVLLLVLCYQTQGKPSICLFPSSMSDPWKIPPPFVASIDSRRAGEPTEPPLPCRHRIAEVTAQPCVSPNHREHRGPRGTSSSDWRGRTSYQSTNYTRKSLPKSFPLSTLTDFYILKSGWGIQKSWNKFPKISSVNSPSRWYTWRPRWYLIGTRGKLRHRYFHSDIWL